MLSKPKSIVSGESISTFSDASIVNVISENNDTRTGKRQFFTSRFFLPVLLRKTAVFSTFEVGTEHFLIGGFKL